MLPRWRLVENTPEATPASVGGTAVEGKRLGLRQAIPTKELTGGSRKRLGGSKQDFRRLTMSNCGGILRTTVRSMVLASGTRATCANVERTSCRRRSCPQVAGVLAGTDRAWPCFGSLAWHEIQLTLRDRGAPDGNSWVPKRSEGPTGGPLYPTKEALCRTLLIGNLPHDVVWARPSSAAKQLVRTIL